MNILDENIPDHQRLLLKNWRIRMYQIGLEVSRKGIKDHEILDFLLTQRRPSFFTRDEDFYKRQWCHARYSLIYLSVGRYEVATFVRRLLCHSEFDTHAKRMGRVVRVSQIGIHVWKLHAEEEVFVSWNDSQQTH